MTPEPSLQNRYFPGVAIPGEAAAQARAGRRAEHGSALSDLNGEQLQLIAALQAAGDGLTVGQLESTLSRSREEIHALLEGLIECRLVTRLNTLVPSYLCRYGKADLSGR